MEFFNSLKPVKRNSGAHLHGRLAQSRLAHSNVGFAPQLPVLSSNLQIQTPERQQKGKFWIRLPNSCSLLVEWLQKGHGASERGRNIQGVSYNFVEVCSVATK